MSGEPARCDHDHVEDRTAAELRESAYRRGFDQGSFLVHQAVVNGTHWSRLAGWRKQVVDWRYRLGRHEAARDEVKRPPAL